MPLYDFKCSRCGGVSEDVMIRLPNYTETPLLECGGCKGRTRHEQILTPPTVQDWGNGGDGRFFEHLGPKGMRFRDKKSYKEHLRNEGLQEWAPKRGMPGQEV